MYIGWRTYRGAISAIDLNSDLCASGAYLVSYADSTDEWHACDGMRMHAATGKPDNVSRQRQRALASRRHQKRHRHLSVRALIAAPPGIKYPVHTTAVPYVDDTGDLKPGFTPATTTTTGHHTRPGLHRPCQRRARTQSVLSVMVDTAS